ncbi:unnamed protein product, partial [Coregonus sp. 'balchen']
MADFGVEELKRLEYLSLVSKVSEFVICLAEKQPTFDGFKSLLLKNGADFTDSLISNLLRLIQTMRPSKASTSKVSEPVVKQKSEKDKLKEMFPGLCRPDNPAPVPLEDDDVKVADAAMKELEMFMPSVSGTNSTSRLDNKRQRSRSRSQDRDRKRRSRSPSCDHERDFKRGRKRVSRWSDRSPSPSRDRDIEVGSDRFKDKHVDRPPPEEPAVGDIFNGKVTSILQFGCFVQLEGLRKRWEGLVHVSELRKEGRVANVADVVQKGQRVKIKVLSFTGSKTSLSMKDVDQETGEDLNPNRRRNQGPDGGEEKIMRNPDRPTDLNLGHAP